MQRMTSGESWNDWLAANADQDDATKLAALREIIVQTGREWVASGEITSVWANKKLAALGITERIDADHQYVLKAPINVEPVRMTVYAINRTAALAQFTSRLAAGAHVFGAEAASDPEFISGPEDSVAAVDDDAPQTVEATLAAFREIVLLANIAGPRFNCDSGGSAILDSYGLAPIPARKTYVVNRPAQVVMSTRVEAYDEASALRVAGWRWEDGHKAYEVSEALANGDVKVEGVGVQVEDQDS